MDETFPNERRIHAYILHHMRLAWRYYSRARKECLASDGCSSCGREEKLFADHVDPVIDPATGFEGWDVLYRRMFGGRLQPLCEACHKAKTKAENNARAKARRQKKKSLENAG